MSRQPRLWQPHAIHHAVARAHCGSPIFAMEDDRAFVVKRAVRAFAETGATCLGWAVLNNHCHVLVRCEGPPGPTFARLNGAIAWRVLRYRGEHGSVFQNRYYSDPCEDPGSVIQRMAYVLGNPVHHRIVPTIDALRSYEWSGLGEVLGLREPRWTDVGAALALLDTDPDRARRSLVQFLEAKAAEWATDGGNPDEDRGLGEGVADDDDSGAPPAPSPALASVPPRPAPRPAAQTPPLGPISCLRNALRRDGWTPARLAAVACELTGADVARVHAGAQTGPEAAARSVVAFVACDLAGFSMVETAPILGVRPTALQYARRRGRERFAELGVAPENVLARSRETAAAPWSS